MPGAAPAATAAVLQSSNFMAFGLQIPAAGGAFVCICGSRFFGLTVRWARAKPGLLKSMSDRKPPSHDRKTPGTGRPGVWVANRWRTAPKRKSLACSNKTRVDAQVVITCLPLTPFAAGKHTAPGIKPRRGPQLPGGEYVRPTPLLHMNS